jgi:uncharacterized membrane protein YdfJ with MMPL/SSD domain
VMMLLGRWNWWPGRVPHVEAEEPARRTSLAGV